MKRIYTLFILIAMVFTLSACSFTTPVSTTEAPEEENAKIPATEQSTSPEPNNTVEPVVPVKYIYLDGNEGSLIPEEFYDAKLLVEDLHKYLLAHFGEDVSKEKINEYITDAIDLQVVTFFETAKYLELPVDNVSILEETICKEYITSDPNEDFKVSFVTTFDTGVKSLGYPENYEIKITSDVYIFEDFTHNPAIGFFEISTPSLGEYTTFVYDPGLKGIYEQFTDAEEFYACDKPGGVTYPQKIFGYRDPEMKEMAIADYLEPDEYDHSDEISDKELALNEIRATWPSYADEGWDTLFLAGGSFGKTVDNKWCCYMGSDLLYHDGNMWTYLSNSGYYFEQYENSLYFKNGNLNDFIMRGFGYPGWVEATASGMKILDNDPQFYIDKEAEKQAQFKEDIKLMTKEEGIAHLRDVLGFYVYEDNGITYADTGFGTLQYDYDTMKWSGMITIKNLETDEVIGTEEIVNDMYIILNSYNFADNRDNGKHAIQYMTNLNGNTAFYLLY